MRKEDLINNLKDLKTELIDPDIYKGTKAFDFLDTINSAINLAEHIIPIHAMKILNKEFLIINDKDFEGIIKESLTHELALYLKDKMDIIVTDYPYKQELMYTGTIYIYDKKGGIDDQSI